MRKVFHFTTSREHYRADAVVVWCFDHRFHLAFAKYLKRSGVVNTDIVKIAGGAKSLASPARETDREFILDQIRASIRLHRTQRVILMTHSDCGAYGGLAGGFGGDPVAEANHHELELRRAAACVREAVADIDVGCYFVDFDGVAEVELTTPPSRKD